MKEQTLILGTRGSKLALIQSEQVKAALLRYDPALRIEMRIIQTQGDRILDTALSKIGDKGLFTKEIEKHLLAGTIDLAVHSLKDMPTRQPDGLLLAAVTQREDPADVLISKGNRSWSQLPAGAVILTGSLRRRAQVLASRPDLRIQDVRGNIQTRLAAFEGGSADAMIMAAAGLKRASLESRITEAFSPRQFLPAPGQGALAVEIRRDDRRLAGIVSVLEDAASRAATTAERTLLARLEGGCQVPIGAYAWLEADRLCLKGLIADLEGKRGIRGQMEGHIQEAASLGERLAEDLLRRGGREILEELPPRDSASPPANATRKGNG
ncbi:MAG: hydroxymethylbilane synthase [Sedimentisphaerales bacterium]|nr:hydroxymethylbilane synthase [Sedimentisphaerales bacterium]